MQGIAFVFNRKVWTFTQVVNRLCSENSSLVRFVYNLLCGGRFLAAGACGRVSNPCPLRLSGNQGVFAASKVEPKENRVWAFRGHCLQNKWNDD